MFLGSDALFNAIHRKKKNDGYTFYHNTLRTKLSPLGIIIIERYGLTAVIPVLTALLLSSLNDLQFFGAFLYTLLEFSCAKHYWYCKCTSRHLFRYGGFNNMTKAKKV